MTITLAAASEMIADRIETIKAMKGDRYSDLVLCAANANNLAKMMPPGFDKFAVNVIGELILSALHAVHIDHKNEHHKLAYEEFLNDLEGIILTMKNVAI